MGGAPHMAKKSTCVSMGCPLATYIKEGGREEAGQVWVRQGGALLGLLVQVGFGPLLPSNGEGKGKGGVLVLLGGGLPSLACPKGQPASLLAPSYTGAGGTLEHTS